MEFKDKLKALRKEKGITQDELASSLFISRTLISKYENGAVYPTKENAIKIAEYFNINLSDLIDQDEQVSLILKENNKPHISDFVCSLIIIGFLLIWILIMLLPLFTVHEYDYSSIKPCDLTPTHYTYQTSLFLKTLNKGNPIAVFSLFFGVVNIAFSVALIKIRVRYWHRIINYSLFTLNIVLAILVLFYATSFAPVY